MPSSLRPPPSASFPKSRFFMIRSPSIPGGEHSFLFVLKMRNESATSCHTCTHRKAVSPPSDRRDGGPNSIPFGDGVRCCERPEGAKQSHPLLLAQNSRFNRSSGYAKESRENPHFLAKSAIFAQFPESRPREIAHFQPQKPHFANSEASRSSSFSGSIRRKKYYANSAAASCFALRFFTPHLEPGAWNLEPSLAPRIGRAGLKPASPTPAPNGAGAQHVPPLPTFPRTPPCIPPAAGPPGSA